MNSPNADPNPHPKPTEAAISQSERDLADLRDLRDLRSGQIAFIRETRSLYSKSLLSSPFYFTTNQRSMASENHTESALTSKLDDLTEIHRLSGLPTEH